MLDDKQRMKTPCACAAARRAARAVTQLYNLVLSPTGLNVTRFIALQLLSEEGEIAQWRLAREHDFSVESLSRRLAGLRREGLVQVRRVPGSNERLYSLTPLGRAKLFETLPHWERAQRRLSRTLGEDRWTELLAALEDLSQAAVEAESARATNAT